MKVVNCDCWTSLGEEGFEYYVAIEGSGKFAACDGTCCDPAACSMFRGWGKFCFKSTAFVSSLLVWGQVDKIDLATSNNMMK